MSRIRDVRSRLDSGELSFDFVGRRGLWFVIAAVVLVVGIAALFVRPLNFGVELDGGVEFRAQVDNPSQSVSAMHDAVTGTGLEDDPIVVSSGEDSVRVQTGQLGAEDVATMTNALEQAGATSVSSESVGPSWGRATAERALLGVALFLALVLVFIAAYFREWKMAVAAVAALGHDVVVTLAIYALSGFDVTPAAVTGLLAIVAYSLYDTVVVFDKVRENTRGVGSSTRRTYADSANLSVNQTLVRSVNTSLVALLPIGALLYVGAFQLGSGPLKGLALVLLVGVAVGTYSSVCLATPLLVQMKRREPGVQKQARRLASRGGTDKAPRKQQRESVAATRQRERRTSSAASKRSQPQRTSRSKRGKNRR